MYIYLCACVCVCVCVSKPTHAHAHAHTHAHAHAHTNVYAHARTRKRICTCTYTLARTRTRTPRFFLQHYIVYIIFNARTILLAGHTCTLHRHLDDAEPLQTGITFIGKQATRYIITIHAVVILPPKLDPWKTAWCAIRCAGI